MQGFLTAKNLGEWVRKIAKEHGRTPDQIRRMTYRDVTRFYAGGAKMPKVKNDG
jgi:hypothetical protein